VPFTKKTRQELPDAAVHGLSVRALFRPEEAERLSVRWIRMEPHQEVPPSRHEVAQEVVYVLEGEAEYWIGTERGVCRAGDFLNIPAGSGFAPGG